MILILVFFTLGPIDLSNYTIKGMQEGCVGRKQVTINIHLLPGAGVLTQGCEPFA